MLPASTNGGGSCVAFPDACLTPAPPAPPVPVPYPNNAQLTQATSGTTSSKVKIMGKETATTNTEISMSSGDEAGNAPGGVASGVFKGGAKFMQGSGKVKAQGHPVCYLGSTIGQNGPGGKNQPMGKQVAPSQTKVTVSA